jgi:hypothetical protein
MKNLLAPREPGAPDGFYPIAMPQSNV